MIQKDRYNYIKIFLILSFISCWVSISTTSYDIYNVLKMYKYNITPTFNEIINCSRQSIVFIIFPFLFILNLSKFSKDNFKNNFPFFCLLFYFICQIPGLIFTQNSLLNIGFIISAINILLVLNLANQLFNKKSLMIFIYINLFFLILIMYQNRTSIIGFWISEDLRFLYRFRDIYGENFFGKVSPRSTGAARTVLLIYIISILVFKNFFNNNRYLKYFLYSIAALLILLFQSRTVIVLTLVFVIFNYFNEKNLSFFKYIIIFLIIPIISLYTLLYVKKDIHISNFNNKNNIENSNLITDHYIRKVDPQSFSSGRIKDWKSLLIKYQKEFKFYGFGAQADRFFIDQSASNGVIYALTSSGLIGIFFYLIFNFSCLIKFLDSSILNYKKYSLENRLSSLIVLLLLLRSILESSFSVFGVDFIIICTFYTYLAKRELLEKNAD